MQAASIAELKKALAKLEQGELLESVLRLARFKKDNKELLTYLLFLSDNEGEFVNRLCEEIDNQFELTPNAHKKTVRKVVRWMNKCLRFSPVKETEIEVRIHFCRTLKASDTPIGRSKVMINMYNGQLKKIDQALEKLHEDIRSDYAFQIRDLEL